MACDPFSSSVASNTSVPYPNTISYQADSSGNWRILITRISGEGDYTLTITVTAASPPSTTPTTPTTPGGDFFARNWPWIAGIDGGVVLILALVIVLVMRKKR
ncbi:MAG: hypothetical protein K9W42_04065 [Candidatus Heimdallarchaeota archaeon]|nr:hypothetical protein [Candidatus Heimdallarchaeota archaeon]